VKYQEVDDAHIVPAGYLRGFAKGSMIMRQEVASNRVRKRSVRSVGIRKRAYSRHRPDGSRIDDVEDAISKLENRVEVLRKAEQRFPFTEEDRSVIAQFAGAQQVRTPKWAKQYEQQVRSLKSEVDVHGLPRLGSIGSEVVHPALKRETERLATDTARLLDMQRWLYGFSALFFAMRWTLIRFPRPILITCDHPVVMWREADRAAVPSDNSGIGVEHLLEVRYPLNSQVCLLMTWLEGVDDSEILSGSRAQAKNINSFTRAAAELEWFSLPDINPPFSDDRSRLVPLSAEIFGEYAEVRIAKRRAFGIHLALKTKNQPLQKHMNFQAFYPGTLKKASPTDSD
jgi:hypothetical protein